MSHATRSNSSASFFLQDIAKSRVFSIHYAEGGFAVGFFHVGAAGAPGIAWRFDGALHDFNLGTAGGILANVPMA